MAEIEIGIGKSGRRGYSLDEVAILPSRRTRDADEVETSWQIDAYQFEIPVIAAPLDGVSSPATAIEMGRLGGAASVHAEGLWCRYEDPSEVLAEIAELTTQRSSGSSSGNSSSNSSSSGSSREAERIERMRQIYSVAVQPDLIAKRVAEIREAGATVCIAVSPASTESLLEHIVRAEPDLLVIQGTVTSAEHLTDGAHEPLDLKHLVRRLEVPVLVGGCASYQAALHLMRTGAAGVLVGVGPGIASTTGKILGVGNPQATAVADARAARMRHLDETGVYVHVIADGGMRTGGDIAKAVVCGADAVMLGSPLAHASEAPASGALWSRSSFHHKLPRGGMRRLDEVGTLEQILNGPADRADGKTNLMGALRKSMAVTGYASLKDFQKADLMVMSPPTIRPGGQ
ncbi:MAG: GuaB3 family IMP dehydrogenase-related protein [Microthrixaceae bacterium]